MANTNYGELWQLFETFTRVWEAGGRPVATSTPWMARPEPHWTSSLALLPAPALEPQMREERGLGLLKAHTSSSAPGDVDRQLKLEMSNGASPGFFSMANCRRKLLTLLWHQMKRPPSHLPVRTQWQIRTAWIPVPPPQVKLCYLNKPKMSLNVITVILNQNRREVSRHILATNINNLKTWR